MQMRELILIRHGETTGESHVRLYGATDVSLSELGMEQMRCVADALATTPVDALVASSLKRSQQGAALLDMDEHAPTVIKPDFREIDFGDWEGLTLEEIAERFPADYERAKSNEANFKYPNGEARTNFRARVAMATRKLLDEHEGRVVAVLHKGVIRTIFDVLLELPPTYRGKVPIELGSIHRLERYRGRWRFVSSNEVAHLGKHRSRTVKPTPTEEPTTEEPTTDSDD